jgi:hypothetical protein
MPCSVGRRSVAVSIVIAVAVAACFVVASRTEAAATTSAVSSQRAGLPAAAASRPLATAFLDPSSFGGSEQKVTFEHAHRAGVRYLRVLLDWAQVAPSGAKAPTGFKARDPGDPRYDWSVVDGQVRAASAEGFTPFISMQGAPTWAQNGKAERASDGPVRPSPAALRDFSAALASRFSGRYGGLPRVRYWQIWNEPNLSIQLMPQSDGEKPLSPNWYRSMVNAAASSIHAVHRDNVVIAGGLAPFGGDVNDPSGGVVPDQERIHPLEFMRDMLCMSKGKRPKATCSEHSNFDVWAHHPYTYGGPTHSAFNPDDVSMGDLGDMRKLLEAAEAAGQIRSRKKVGFWVTEFSYDSKPGDPKGLDPGLHARWVSEALYRMWSNGVSMVTWFLLRDEPFPDQMFQSGLYTRGPNGIASDKPKPALRAFRFPFVAFRQRDGAITYWGRTPAGAQKAVVVEQQRGGWKRVAVPSVNRYGIFQGAVQSRGNGLLRARLVDGSDSALPFSLNVPKDFRFCPWGSYC